MNTYTPGLQTEGWIFFAHLW